MDHLYSFRVSGELRDALQKLKERDGISASEAIRRGLVEFLQGRGIRVLDPKKGGKRTTRPKKT